MYDFLCLDAPLSWFFSFNDLINYSYWTAVILALKAIKEKSRQIETGV